MSNVIWFVVGVSVTVIATVLWQKYVSKPKPQPQVQELLADVHQQAASSSSAELWEWYMRLLRKYGGPT